MVKTLLVPTLVLLAWCGPLPAQLNRHTLTQRAARKLVQQALVALDANQHFRIEPWRYYWAPEFYTFQAWRPGPVDRDGLGVIQTYYFAVNPCTGDVWDAMACSRVTSRTIQQEQQLIWQRSHLPAEVRQTIRDKTPADCSDSKPTESEVPPPAPPLTL